MDASADLESIERLAMDAVRNPGASQRERTVALAVLREVCPALPAHEARITDLLMLLRDRLEAPADVAELLRLLRALIRDDALRTSAIVKIARRAYTQGAHETLRWLVEAGVIPDAEVEPAWRAERARRAGPRLSVSALGLSRDLGSAIEYALSSTLGPLGDAGDERSLEGAARADIAFLIVDASQPDARGYARFATRVLRERGALVIGLVLRDPSDDPASSNGERGGFGHAFFVLEKSEEVSADARSLLESIDAIVAPVTETKGVTVAFPPLRALLREGGRLSLGSAAASGGARASIAAERAIIPLLGATTKSSHLLVRIRESSRVTVGEIDDVTSSIRERLPGPASLTLTTGFGDPLDCAIHVSILATQTTSPETLER